MKKVLSLILALVLCVGLCACDSASNKQETSNARKITQSEIKKALSITLSQGVSEKLEVESSGDSAKSFTWTISNINTKPLADKNSAIGAVNELMSGKARPDTYRAAVAIGCVMQAISLIDPDVAAQNTIIETSWSVACANKVIEKDGWALSASINQSTSTLTITGKQVG